MIRAAALILGLGLAGCGREEPGPVGISTPRASGPLAVDPVRGRLLAVDPALSAVHVLDVRHGVTWEVALPDGAAPRQIAVSADGALAYAPDAALRQLHVVSLDDATVVRSVDVGNDPHGVVAGPVDAPDVWLAHWGYNQLQRYNAVGTAQMNSWSLGWGDDSAPIDEGGNVSNGWDPRAVAIDATGAAVFVGHQMNARISTVSSPGGEIDATFLSSPVDEDPSVPQGKVYGLESMALSPDGGTLYVPHILWNPRISYEDGRTVWPALSIVSTDPLEEVDVLVPGDGLDGLTDGEPSGFASPRGVAVSDDGARVFVTFEGSDELAVVDPVAREVTAVLRLDQAGPTGIVVDGGRAWVLAELDHAVVELDVSDPDAPAVVAVTSLGQPAEDGMAAGRALFRRAWDPAGTYPPSAGGRVACASCHVDGMNRTIRWFVLDQQRSGGPDARFGHLDSVAGFTSPDPDAAVADLVRMFQNVGGLSAAAGGVDVDPDAPPDDLRPALEELEQWLHGPDNLPFLGSWASTDTREPVDPADLVSDEVCGECHAEILAEYRGSVHANAGLNDPFFQAIEADLLDSMDGGFTSWCLGCHSPTALITGSTSFHDGPAPDEARRGITCLGCHGVVDFRAAEGNNGMVYGIEAVLAAGFPEGDEDPTAHALAMTIDPSGPSYEGKLRLGSSGFCGTCHQSYTPGIGVTEFLTYQEYLDSPFHGNEHENEKQCADCHMPDDQGWRDHSFAGPSTWFLKQYGTDAHRARHDELMTDVAALELDVPATVPDGASLPVEVLVRNVGAGHKLPTGVSNLRELWLDVRVTADGVEVFRSGELGADGALPDSAVRFGKRAFDASGAPLDLHQIWRIARVIDTTIAPGGYGTGAWDAPIPAGAVEVEVEVVLRYRSLPRHIVEHAQGEEAPALEITDLASATAHVDVVP